MEEFIKVETVNIITWLSAFKSVSFLLYIYIYINKMIFKVIVTFDDGTENKLL